MGFSLKSFENVTFLLSMVFFLCGIVDFVKTYLSSKIRSIIGILGFFLIFNIIGIINFSEGYLIEMTSVFTKIPLHFSFAFNLASGSLVLIIPLVVSLSFPSVFHIKVKLLAVLLFFVYLVFSLLIAYKANPFTAGAAYVVFYLAGFFFISNFQLAIKKNDDPDMKKSKEYIYGLFSSVWVLILITALTVDFIRAGLPNNVVPRIYTFVCLVFNINFFVLSIIRVLWKCWGLERKRKEKNLISFKSGLTAAVNPACELTIREEEVFYRLLEGAAYKEIATDLHISVSTVKTHVLNIYKKADVKSKTELSEIYQQHLLYQRAVAE